MSDRLWIMVDLEASGPIIGRHSMTELGAVVGTRTQGVIDQLELVIAPKDAMQKFADWSKPYRDKRVTFIARPSCFDWPWVVWYAWTYLGENPFGFRALCASSWFEARGKKFSVELPHVAVDDAKIQLLHFFREG